MASITQALFHLLKIENGEIQITLKRLGEIANALDVCPLDLLLFNPFNPSDFKTESLTKTLPLLQYSITSNKMN